MKKITSVFFVLSLFYTSYLKAYSSNPEQFISEIVTDAINTLSDKSLSKEKKSNFVENIALENVDINALGLYTLGELRKSSDEQTLQKYQNSFERYF